MLSSSAIEAEPPLTSGEDGEHLIVEGLPSEYVADRLCPRLPGG